MYFNDEKRRKMFRFLVGYHRLINFWLVYIIGYRAFDGLICARLVWEKSVLFEDLSWEKSVILIGKNGRKVLFWL